ncbi:MAG: FUSC family protein [Victivallales bacterium]|nr:FUSC family protein [Victivallales bacterium]MCF7888573.1 FUSC family protein [Victivallales bacterium]
MSVKYHFDLLYNDLDYTFKTFKWDSTQTETALKTALSCATAVLIANWIKLDNPFWAGVTALVVMRPNVGAIFQKGWMRALGCIIGCQLLCLFLVGYFIQNPLLFSLFIFTGICIAFYVGVQAKYGYFWSYMTSNMALIAMIILSNPYNNFPIHIVFCRSAEILLGVLVSWFYSIILWPRYAGDELSKNTSVLLRNSLSYIREIFNQYMNGKIKSAAVNDLLSTEITPLLAKSKSLISSSQAEKKLLPIDHEKYKTVLSRLERRLDEITIAYQSYTKLGCSGLIQENKPLFNEIIEKIDEIMDIDSGFTEKSVYIKFEELENELYTTEQYLKNLKCIKFQKYRIEEVLLFYKLLYSIQSFTEDVKFFLNNDTSFTQSVKTEDFNFENPDSDFTGFNFFSKKITLYIPAIKNAVKGGLAILFTFWICLWMNIPGGLGNMSVAIIAVFSVQLDNVRTKQKGFLRFFGCLYGAAFGLLFLSFNIQSTIFLVTIIFLFCFFCCIIWAGRPGSAYLGLQAGIAFIICLAGGFEPAVTFDAVIERLTGIFIAISMMWFFHYIMFPENLHRKLKSKITDLRNTLCGFINSKHFLTGEKHIADEYSKAASELNFKAVSLIKVLEIQQDLPPKETEKIKNWSSLIEQLAKKIKLLSSIDTEVYKFITDNSPKFFKHLKFITTAILKNNDLNNYRIKYLTESFDELIELNITEIRKRGTIRDKSIKFKEEFAAFITILKHFVSDLKNISEIEINFDYLNA